MRNRYVLVMALVMALNINFMSRAQSPYVVEVPKHSFINYDTNIIQYYGDSTILDTFYTKLKAALDTKETNVNIMHVGGSHIQADIWSGIMRFNLQTLEPHMKGERGMVFPLHIARTNNPNNYKTKYTGQWEKCRSAQKLDDCPVGLLGYRVRTYDTLTTFKIYCYDEYYPLDYESKCVKIYYDMSDKSYTPFVVDSGIRMEMTVYKDLGYAEYQFNSKQDTIFFEIERTEEIQEYFDLYGIQLENDDPGVVYQNIGCNGADVPAYINSSWLEQHLKSVDVDLVIFSIGINDAYDSEFTAESYKKNYDTLINIFRRVHPNANILFTTNNDSHRNRVPNKRAFVVREVMQELCVEYNAAMWDMFEIMGGLGSMDKWVAANLAKRDRIHFKNNGYRLIGNLMYNALINDFHRFLENGPD